MSLEYAKVTTHGFSHIGQRNENQDRFAILDSHDGGSRLLVVADGLGGHTGGLLAAETIVATAESCWRSRDSELPPEGFLELLVRECHRAVRNAGREQGLDAHSTIVALLLQDGQAVSAHAGDSRVMQYSETSFIDRTLDHSVAQLLAFRGTISDDEIAGHPDQNRLFMQVGGHAAPDAEIKRWNIADGRRFVLCSDGFWEMFRHDEIVELFMSDDPEAEMTRRLELELKQLENHDNTTAILAEVIPGDAVQDESPEGEASEDEVSLEIVANDERRQRRWSGPALACVVATALLMLLHAAETAVAQGEGGNVEPRGPPVGQAESLPILLQSSDIVLNRPAEPGDDVAEAVAEELRERQRLSADDSLANVSESRELGEITVLRMRQEHRGIPVFAAEVAVSTLDGRIVRIAGDSTADILLDSIVPANDYPSTVALAETLTDLAITPQDDGVLVVFAAENGGRLAWAGPAIIALDLERDSEEFPEQAPAEIPGPDLAPSLEQIYLDAANGEVLLRLPLVHQVLDRRVHDFSQACRDAGIGRPMNARTALVRAQTLIQQSPLVRSEAIGGWHRNAERLFDTLGGYYRFLRLTLDIDSIDDAGKPLVGYIGARFDEVIPGIPQCVGDEFMAFWMPTNAMILTDAVLDFSELIGHEATHGLVDHGSRLIYRHQSGALHESIADSLGIAFRGWNEDGARPDIAAEVAMSTGNWQIREPGGVLRDFQTPTSVQLPDGTLLPDHYDDYLYLSADIDNGGIHINSSIMNHGFYLLAAGGRHTRLGHDPEVAGIGVLKAARIVGTAAVWLLTPAADFEDARYGFAHAAEALHGENSMEWIAVHTAMDAIGIPGYWVRPPESEPPEPMAQPQPPEPEPASGTSSAPQSTAVPPNSTTPQSPPPSPVLSPDPNATRPPAQTEASVEPPASSRNESLDPAATSGGRLGLFLAAALALVGAGIVVYAYRPGRSSPTRWKPAGWKSRSQPVSAPAPASLGTLRPADDTPAISLRRELLVSREGLVIGRAASICHVEIRDPAVSRRHARIRLADGIVVIEDLNSAAGTRLDGRRLEPFKPTRVEARQTLAIAGRSYTFESAPLSD